MDRTPSIVPHELELRLCSNPPPTADHRSQKMTIFYDGRMVASELTGSQAQAIIELAKKEVQEGNRDKDSLASQPPAAPLLNPGLSMKRSLQRFLQKRKERIVDHDWPYGHRRRPLMQLFS